MALSNRENNNFREQLLINDAEGKLTQSVFPEFVKINWPSMRSGGDRPQSISNCNFEVAGGNMATISIPTE